MRVLSGHFKGHPLKSPKGEKTRPTSSKVKESLFNILQSTVEEIHVLDLFAGSGALGIEALSRGAASATFVEKAPLAANCIRFNLKSLDAKGRVMQMDALRAVRELTKKNSKFTLILLDPPYNLEIGPLLETLPELLEEQGLIVLEQGKRAALSPERLRLTDERRFGDTTLFFFIPLER